jgi:hypothetical protein
MVRVETSWQDERGVTHTSVAMLEDSSRDGAGLRLRRPIPVGQKIEVRSLKEQFTAIVMNCHQNGADYFIGVKREKAGVLVTK